MFVWHLRLGFLSRFSTPAPGAHALTNTILLNLLHTHAPSTIRQLNNSHQNVRDRGREQRWERWELGEKGAVFGVCRNERTAPKRGVCEVVVCQLMEGKANGTIKITARNEAVIRIAICTICSHHFKDSVLRNDNERTLEWRECMCFVRNCKNRSLIFFRTSVHVRRRRRREHLDIFSRFENKNDLSVKFAKYVFLRFNFLI